MFELHPGEGPGDQAPTFSEFVLKVLAIQTDTPNMDTPPIYSDTPAINLNLSKAFSARYRSERYRALDPSVARALIHVQARCVAYHDAADTLAMLDRTRPDARTESRADTP